MFNNRPAINRQTSGSTTVGTLSTGSNVENSTGISADVYHIRDRVQRKLLAETDGDVTLGHVP